MDTRRQVDGRRIIRRCSEGHRLPYRAAGGFKGAWRTALYESVPSVITISWSAGDVREDLGGPAGRPGDSEAGDGRRATQADRLDQRIAPEAAVVADRPVDRPRRPSASFRSAWIGPRSRIGWSGCRPA